MLLESCSFNRVHKGGGLGFTPGYSVCRQAFLVIGPGIDDSLRHWPLTPVAYLILTYAVFKVAQLLVGHLYYGVPYRSTAVNRSSGPNPGLAILSAPKPLCEVTHQNCLSLSAPYLASGESSPFKGKIRKSALDFLPVWSNKSKANPLSTRL